MSFCVSLYVYNDKYEFKEEKAVKSYQNGNEVLMHQKIVIEMNHEGQAVEFS